MANNRYNRYTNSRSKQYFTSASSNAAIKSDSNEIQKMHTDVSALIGDCRELYSRVINVASNLDGEVLSRYSISSLLSALQNSISKSIEALESNNNGLNTYNNEINNADRLLANSMRGVQSLANMIVTPEGIFAPFNIGGQIVMANIALLNGLFGLNTTTSTQGTNLGFFDSIKQFGVDMFNKAKNTVTGVVDFVTTNKDKLIATALDLGSIALSGIAAVGSIAAATGATVATFGAGVVTYGGAAVCVTYAGNNIANRWADIWNRWDGNDANDDMIGNVNFLKEGLTNAGGYVGNKIAGEGGEEFGRWLGGTAVYGAGEVFSALHSSENISKGLEFGASKLGMATETTSKILTNNATKQAINVFASRAGLGDDKGAIATETLDYISNQATGEGIRNGEWISNFTNTGFDVYDIYKDLKTGDIPKAVIENDLISNSIAGGSDLFSVLQSPLVIN